MVGIKAKDRGFYYKKFLSGKIEINEAIFEILYQCLNDLTEQVEPLPFVYIGIYVDYSIKIVTDTIINNEDIDAVALFYCSYLDKTKNIYQKIFKSNVLSKENLRGIVFHPAALLFISEEIASYLIPFDTPTLKYKTNQWFRIFKYLNKELARLKKMKKVYSGGFEEEIKEMLNKKIDSSKQLIKVFEVTFKEIGADKPRTKHIDYDFKTFFNLIFPLLEHCLEGLPSRFICEKIIEMLDALELEHNLSEDALLKRINRGKEYLKGRRLIIKNPKKPNMKLEPKTYFEQRILREKKIYQKSINRLLERETKHGIETHYKGLNLNLFEETVRNIYKKLLARAIKEKQIYPREVLDTI